METIGKLWHRGGIWARLAIVIIALWPVLITFAAFIGWSFLTAIVALLPLAAIVFGLIALIDPLVIAVIGTVWPKFLKTSALIIGTELAIGVYFSAVPVENERGLIPLALLLLLAIIFLVLGQKMKIIASILIILFLSLTLIFIFGRDKAWEKTKEVVEWIIKPSTTPQPQPTLSTTVPSETQLKPAEPPMWPVGAVETVTLNKGDTVETKLWVKRGMVFISETNKTVLIGGPEKISWFKVGPGRREWWVATPPQPGRMVGLHDSTVVEWTRIL